MNSLGLFCTLLGEACSIPTHYPELTTCACVIPSYPPLPTPLISFFFFSSPTQTLVTVSDHVHSAQVSTHNLRAKVTPFPFPLFLVFPKPTATQALLFSKYTGDGGGCGGISGCNDPPRNIFCSWSATILNSDVLERENSDLLLTRMWQWIILLFFPVPHRQVCR